MTFFKRWLTTITLALLPLPLLAQSLPTRNAPLTRWIAYYGNDANSDFAPYQLIVLHHAHKLPVRQINSSHKTVLAYLSLGESGPDAPDFALIKQRGLLMENMPTHWPNNLLVDARNPAWAAYLLEELIPQMLAEGFDGIMIDTLDSLIEAEKRQPALCDGMSKAAIDIVRTIRAHYPQITIMVNRGFDILPNIASDIDMVLAESIYANYGQDGTSSLFPTEVYDAVSTMLQQTKTSFPHLQLLTLDYWPPDDEDGLRKIYAAQRGKGFAPYAATFDLTKIIAEPK